MFVNRKQKANEYMLKKVFLLSGMSESGKSTAGKYLDSKGVKRLKIVTFLKRVMEAEGISGDFAQWNFDTENQRPDWLAQRFVEEFERYCQEQQITYCCLESLYRPTFAESMRLALPTRVVVVFVDIPQEQRIIRQMNRQGLPSIEAAREYILPRDHKKEIWGTPLVKDMADEIIDNSGTVEDLYGRLDTMLNKYDVSSA
jgi:dephospho-CoA kinase